MSEQLSTDAIRPDGIYTLADVALLVFQRSTAWLYSHRARLVADDRFPRPISSVGRPRWLGTDLLDWITRPKDAELPRADMVPADGSRIDLTYILRERAKAVARGEALTMISSPRSGGGR